MSSPDHCLMIHSYHTTGHSELEWVVLNKVHVDICGLIIDKINIRSQKHGWQKAGLYAQPCGWNELTNGTLFTDGYESNLNLDMVMVISFAVDEFMYNHWKVSYRCPLELKVNFLETAIIYLMLNLYKSALRFLFAIFFLAFYS